MSRAPGVIAAVFSMVAVCLSALAAPPAIRAGIEIEDLGAPVESSVVVRESLVQSEVTGDMHLVGNLASNPLQIFDFNMTKKTAYVTDPIPKAGWRSWNGFPHTNGCFYFGTEGPMLIEYNPETQAVRTWKGVVPPHTRGDMGHMYEGKDGRMVVSSYGKYFWRFDPKTEELERFGPIPWNKYFYTMAYREPYYYVCLAGGGDWFLGVWNLDTGKYAQFLDPTEAEKGKNYVRSVGEDDDGNVYFCGLFDRDGKRVTRCYQLVDGKPTEVPKKPATFWASHHQASRKSWPVQKAGELGLELDLSRMTPTGWNDGTVLFRWRKKDDAEWTEQTVKAKQVEPATLRRMDVTPEGTLLGCTEPYGLFFTYDPETGESTYLGRPPGNVYDLIVRGDKAYMSGYSKMFAVFDRTKPWTYVPGTTEKATNPQPLLGWGKRNCYMALGKNGKVYVGGRESRHASGGVVGVYDPLAGGRDKMRDEFAAKQIFDLVTINDGGIIVVSWQDEIVAFDADERKIIRTIPKPEDAILAGNLFDGGKDCVVCVSAFEVPEKKDERLRTKAIRNPGLVYKVNVRTGEVLCKAVSTDYFFAGTFRELNRRMRLGPDGCGWFFVKDEANKQFLARVRPDDATVERVIETGFGGHVLFMGDDVYMYNGGESGLRTLKRIKNILQR